MSSCRVKSNPSTSTIDTSTTAFQTEIETTSQPAEITPAPTDLAYVPIVKSDYNFTTGECYGNTGIAVALDSTQSLCLYVDEWNSYLKLPLIFDNDDNSWESYFKIRMTFFGADIVNDHLWLIVPDMHPGRHLNQTLSVFCINRNGEFKRTSIDLGQELQIQRISCDFFDQDNGKLIITYYDWIISHYTLLYETNDGGSTWTLSESDTMPESPKGGACMEPTTAYTGFVNSQIGMISFQAKFNGNPTNQTWLTFDGGHTWQKWNADLDYLFKKNANDGKVGTVKDIKLIGETLQLTVDIWHEKATPSSYELFFYSNDLGKTWTIQE
ncbi:MAG: hypothetical protein IJW55_09400 [Clostridia bacterium]|nr:hypothetical protein [Clostridia bacterium]